ncbi:MAG TPA: DUF2934 domain-containing protein [Geminicoccus sp.]|jgi:hypothetical protein|uniref:DUF2934 domain-containing protein n=1 Tax=Geminicoccus sp. TaxID=2024832 RepID=UPI002E34DCDD|nr:DUF2934 domain-containing protein [Geminicoccus sp.]HEX2525749.1 DUF2934 domain-containing protein [Geminicoccus sp.]
MAARTRSSSVERQEIEALAEAERRSPSMDPSLAIFGRDVDSYDSQGETANSEDATVQDWAVADASRPDLYEETVDGLGAYDEEARHAAEDIADEDPWEQRVRRKAYELWESEGGMHGRSEDHWHLAAQLVAEEDGHRSSLLPYEAGLDQPVEESRIQENLGEFPSLADQGDDNNQGTKPPTD